MKNQFISGLLPLICLLFITAAKAETALVGDFIMSDGTFNIEAIGSKQLSLDLAGWQVALDPERGPVFSTEPQMLADSWTALGSGLNAGVSAMAVSGTDIYVGGTFTGVGAGGTAVPGLNYIAKWESALQAQTSGQVLDFDGNNNHVSIGNLGNVNNWTIELWFKPKSLRNYENLFHSQDLGSNQGVRLEISQNWSSGHFYVSVAGTNTFIPATIVPLSGDLSLDWHHLAIVGDKANNKLFVYLDGEKKVDKAQTNWPTTFPNFVLGRGFSAGADRNFNGAMDEFRIWNFAKNQEQVAAQKNTELTGTEPGLVTYYNFNQGIANGTNTSVTTLQDRAGSKNGSLQGFALTGTNSNWVLSTPAIAPSNPIAIAPSNSIATEITSGGQIFYVYPENQLGLYNWNEAKTSCENLVSSDGKDNWVLPSKEQLMAIYQNKEMIGGSFPMGQTPRRQSLLISEVHHRVKNNLQLVMSLLTLKGRKIPEAHVQVHFDDLASKVNSIALIHEHLYRAEAFDQVNLRDYLRELSNHFQALQHDPQPFAIHLEAEALLLNLETVLPLGIIVAELISNSLKYARLPDEPLTLSISVQQQQYQYFFRYQDNGPGYPGGTLTPKPDSMGGMLISSMVRQLLAESRTHNAEGAVFTLSFREKPISVV